MKNSFKALLYLGMALSNFAGPTSEACTSPDFEKIRSELRAQERISGAMNVRDSYLSAVCNLEDLSKLAEFEGGTYFSEKYRETISYWVASNVGKVPSTDDFKKLVFDFAYFVVPKLSHTWDSVYARRMLLPKVKTCMEFTILTYPWKVYPSEDEMVALKVFSEEYRKPFCP